MTQHDWKSRILARRAGFLAAALAGAGVAAGGCNKDKPESSESEPRACLSMGGSYVPPVGEEGSMGQPCLRPRLDPAPAASALAPNTDHPFVMKAGDKTIVEGVLRAEVDGPDVPFAANVAAGPLMHARIRSCFVEAAQSDKPVAGTIELTLELGPDGRITSSSATSTGTIGASLRDCIVASTKNLGFHPVEDGKTSKVRVIMRFPK